MKKLLWILGGLFVAALVAIVSVPLFVNVDQYRPYIVAEANKKMNGKLELGALKLGLWGAVKIHAESIVLRVNGFPEPLLNTKQVHLEIPFTSLLSGSPTVTVVLEKPEIRVVKEADGRMNATELLKTETAQVAPEVVSEETTLVSAAPEKAARRRAEPETKPGPVPASSTEEKSSASATPTEAPATEGESYKVPALIAGARLGLRIQEGDLRYLDKSGKAEYQVTGLDLDAKNLGLGSDMEVRLRAPLKGSSASLAFSGPVSAEARLKPLLIGNQVKSASGSLSIDATDLSLELKSGAFRKPSGMAFKASLQLNGSETETLLRAFDLVLADFKMHGKGRLVASPLSVKLDITTDPGTIRLDKVHAFVPMVEAYQLKGIADFNADVDWRPEAVKASGNLKVHDGGFFLKGMIREPMQFRLQAGFTENTLNLTRAAVSGPETELELTGTVKNFLAPAFSFALSGKSLNIDKAVVLPSGGKSAASGFSLFPVAVAAPSADQNPLLDLAKNPVVAAAGGTFTAKIQKLTAYGAVLEQVMARASLNRMALRVSEASFRTFGGSVKGQADVDLKSPALGFSSQGQAAGINAQSAFKTYFPKYENTLEGLVDASWNVSGAAYPAATRIRSLKGGAKLMAKDGAVKSVDFQESINSAMQKIPFLKNQKPIKVDNGFKTLTADLRFENGTIRAEPIEVYPRNQGFVVKGKSTIQESLEQETFLDVFDPQGQLPKELQNPGKPAIPLRIFGPITAPKTDFDYTLKRVAASAGKNVLKDQALKALGVTNDPGKSDSDKLKDAADALRKKFGF